MSVRDTIHDVFKEVAAFQDVVLKNEIKDDSVLLETGLDSLGFAVLVVRLEERLGYDPFIVMESPVYPVTFKDFVDIYEQYELAEGQ
ncbi:MAG: acyl carrier protein [Deltaproteobacteria bacterium]|nr:acyl carrier protein [Deltaproteobacteria bacterium]TLN01166.1 MAG: acyl carrier protein [bacterium]